MIKAEGIHKTFEDFTALDNITCSISDGCIYGMVGSNGAGKSTFLRVLSGIYKPDKGCAYIDNAPIYENPKVKENIVFVADELFFLPGATINKMAALYSSIYNSFDWDRYLKLTELFELNPKKPIANFSKGMKRQAAIILALSTRAKYMFFDETFDGLDPVMRQAVKSLFVSEIMNRDFTPVIASHNMRELEDVCDHVGFLHRGGVLMEQELDDLRLGIHKIQAVFPHMPEKEQFSGLDIVRWDTRGSLVNMVVRGEEEEILKELEKWSPVFCESLHLTLEEVFISEMEAAGYDLDNILK